MPQTATQRNPKPSTRTHAPQPLPDSSGAQTENTVYGLVSVLYHALQGQQACEQYVEDAEQAGDAELVKFFEQCRDQQNELAARAKQLLVLRADDDDDRDSGSDEEGED